MDKFNAEDFIQLTSSTDKAETERLVKKIFSAVDVDNSGFIDQAEMLRMMTLFGEYMRQKAHSDDQVTDQIIKEMAEQGLKEMDINNDGKVSQEEFLKYALEQNGLSQ